MAQEVYGFAEAFVRKILSLAVRGDLLRAAPGAFEARFFAAPGQKIRTPRQHLAEVIEQFAKDHPGDRLDEASMDEMVRQLAQRLKPAERTMVDAEWREIRNTVVTDPTYVVSKVRTWAQNIALSGAVVQVAALLEAAQRRGQEADLKEIRKLMDGAMAVGQGSDGTRGYLLRDAAERLQQWQADQSGDHLATGFETLDRTLDGGPMYGEVFYIMAPPKGAKTAFLLSAALNAARNRHHVAFFSYEMMFRRMLMRMDRNLASATKHELRKDTKPLELAFAGMQAAGAGEVIVHQFQARKQGCAEACRVVEELRLNGHPIDLVVLDYLNIMSSETQEREKRHELARISREMSALGHELKSVVWSGALVKREAVNKKIVYKTDIAEAFEVIAVLDGGIAICGDEEMRKQHQRKLFLAALREEEDERSAGTYEVDLARMRFREVEDAPAEDPQQPEASGG